MAKNRDDYIREHDEDGTDIVSFHLVDKATVARRMREGDIQLPKKKVDVPKDKRWNTKQLNSKLLAGILNGDPVPNIANSLMDVIGKNEASATRNARTMITGAENAGRKDSYKALEEQGVIQKKVWIATADDRTRESHLMLDGEEVDVDEPFSNGLMYPGDPSGEPEEVWNCRCTMRTHIVGIVRQDTGEVIDIKTPHESPLHAQQIALEEKRREENKPEEEKPKKPEISFTPAQTIEEAEEYARQNFVVESMFSGRGNVSYHGMSLDHANMINEEFTRLYAETDMPKLNNIGMMNFREKIWKDGKDAPMAYRAMQSGEIYFNPKILKDEKTLAAYMKKGEESFEFCKNNMDKFSGKTLEMVQQYMQAGRQTVAEITEKPLQAMLDHEFGHHIDHNVIKRNSEYNQIAKDGMSEYALNLSGYAIQTKGEYIAESYCAYRNGVSGVDPELIKIFEEAVEK